MVLAGHLIDIPSSWASVSGALAYLNSSITGSWCGVMKSTIRSVAGGEDSSGGIWWVATTYVPNTSKVWLHSLPNHTSNHGVHTLVIFSFGLLPCMTPRELQSDGTGVQSLFRCIFCNRGGFGSKKAVRIHVQRVRACRKMHGRLCQVLNKPRKVSRVLTRLFRQAKRLSSH